MSPYTCFQLAWKSSTAFAIEGICNPVDNKEGETVQQLAPFAYAVVISVTFLKLAART